MVFKISVCFYIKKTEALPFSHTETLENPAAIEALEYIKLIANPDVSLGEHIPDLNFYTLFKKRYRIKDIRFFYELESLVIIILCSV